MSEEPVVIIDEVVLLTAARDALKEALTQISAAESDDKVKQAEVLRALVQYLADVRIPPNLTTPIVQLGQEIAHEIIGTNQKPLAEAQRMAACAAAVDYLKENLSVPVEQACRLVAKAAGSRFKHEQLRDFRNNIGKGHARPEAHKYYDFCRTNNRRFDVISVERRQGALLASISAIYGQTRK